MHHLDLSHVIEDGMTTYPGLPGPIVCDYLTRERSRELYAPGTEFQIGVVTICSNTGTYVDSPFHRDPDGIDLSELPLERLAGLDAVVVDAPDRAADADLFRGVDVAGRAVLVRTGWHRHWRTPACEHLADLAALPAEGFRFSAVPVPIKGMGTFPVRAYASFD